MSDEKISKQTTDDNLTIFNIKTLTMIGALMMAVVSFWLSFTAVSGLAGRLGIEPSWLFPVMIDGFLVLTLIWRFNDKNEIWPQITMLSYVIISVALNFYAHDGNVASGVCAALAPITLMAASEVSARLGVGIGKEEIMVRIEEEGKGRGGVNRSIKDSGVIKSRPVMMRDANGRFCKRVEE